MKIQPARRLNGRLRLPGDKSISHRAAMLAALAAGRTRIENFSTSHDCASTLACLDQLGASIKRSGTSVLIEGVGFEGFVRAPSQALDCGNSGSTMRLLAGVLAGQDFVSELTGDGSLRSRPMKRIIEPLELMGARIFSAERGCAPLRIAGRRPLSPITYEMPIASAQVKSCILLAGLNAGGRTEVIERGGPSRDHTERMLGWFGVPVETTRQADGDESLVRLSVAGPAKLGSAGGVVPGDISSAIFFIAAAALLPGSRLEIEGVGLNPTRARVLGVLRELGVDARPDKKDLGWQTEDFGEPFGNISVHGGAGLAPLEDGRSNVLRGALIPQLIDELPMLAVLGSQVLGGLTIRDAKELRVKESDRIAATVKNLRAMGALVEEYEDGLTVDGPTRLRGAALDSEGDHRMAMAFAVAALVADGESELAGADAVGVSFPEFFQLLEALAER